MGKPQVAGVYEKILECAKKEFLEKGFEGASLRVIAQEAGTSTNSIYVRFKDKVGVFEALVQPAADGLKELIRIRQNTFGSMSPQDQSAQIMEYSDQHFPDILAYIYDHFADSNFWSVVLMGHLTLISSMTCPLLMQSATVITSKPPVAMRLPAVGPRKICFIFSPAAFIPACWNLLFTIFPEKMLKKTWLVYENFIPSAGSISCTHKYGKFGGLTVPKKMDIS